MNQPLLSDVPSTPAQPSFFPNTQVGPLKKQRTKTKSLLQGVSLPIKVALGLSNQLHRGDAHQIHLELPSETNKKKWHFLSENRKLASKEFTDKDY